MSKRGTYKYFCEDCSAENWLSSRERTSSFRPRCTSCGSTWLKPSHGSLGPKKITAAHDACKASIETINRKMGKEK